MLFEILVWYLIYGVILTLIVYGGHLIIAELKGYRALEFWANEKNWELVRFVMGVKDYDKEDKLIGFVRLTVNIVIWPINIPVTIEDLFPTLYLLYYEKE